MDTNMAAGNQQRHLSLTLIQKREFISQGNKKKIKIILFFNTLTVQKAKFTEISHFFNQHDSSLGGKCRVTQNLRNSKAVYHKTKKASGAKICMNISF